MSGASGDQYAFVEAGMGILMAVIMADGKFTQDEFVWWKTAQNNHPLFRDVPSDVFNPMLARVKAELGAQPWKALVDKWAQSVPEPYRESMFALACELAVADHDVGGGEPEVISYVWRAFGLPEASAHAIFMKKFENM